MPCYENIMIGAEIAFLRDQYGFKTRAACIRVDHVNVNWH